MTSGIRIWTQGVMGMRTRLTMGEDEQVALALYEQYMPRFAGTLPALFSISSAVAMADKLDTIVKYLRGIGQAPKVVPIPRTVTVPLFVYTYFIGESSYNLDLTDLIGKAKSY